MSKAAGLREARENAYWPDFVPGNAALSRAILDAIDIALPILEADPELVERIAGAIVGYYWDAEKVTDEHDREAAREILAAISTPTPGAE